MPVVGPFEVLVEDLVVADRRVERGYRRVSPHGHRIRGRVRLDVRDLELLDPVPERTDEVAIEVEACRTTGVKLMRSSS